MGGMFGKPVEVLQLDSKMKAYHLAPNESLTLSATLGMDLQTKLLKLNSDIGSKSHFEIGFKVLAGALPSVFLTANTPDDVQKLSVQNNVEQDVETCVTLDEKNSDMFHPGTYYVTFLAGPIGAKFTVASKIVTLSMSDDGSVGRSHRSMTLLKYDMDPALQHADLAQQRLAQATTRENHQV